MVLSAAAAPKPAQLEAPSRLGGHSGRRGRLRRAALIGIQGIKSFWGFFANRRMPQMVHHEAEAGDNTESKDDQECVDHGISI